MSPGMQTKLLRVLQEGEVRRVGDTGDCARSTCG
jgi:transcriptional regulator with PAS, ATPase and Fis domain